MITYNFTIPYWVLIMFIFIETIRMLDTKIIRALFKGIGISRKDLACGLFIGFLISPLIQYIDGFISALFN